MTPQGMSAGSTLLVRTLDRECLDGSIYLLSELARREVEQVLGPGGLLSDGGWPLHEQRSEPDMIASRVPGRFTCRGREG
jgi:hypothetical protein